MYIIIYIYLDTDGSWRDGSDLQATDLFSRFSELFRHGFELR